MAGLSLNSITEIALSQYVTSKYFGGCYSTNSIPVFPSKTDFVYIVNSAEIEKPGKHWLLIVKAEKNSIVEFFDSLGQRPSKYHQAIESYIHDNSWPYYISNNFRYQRADSTLCGLYCLVVASMRFSGKSMENVLKHFNPENLHMNEILIKNYFQDYTSVKILKPHR